MMKKKNKDEGGENKEKKAHSYLEANQDHMRNAEKKKEGVEDEDGEKIDLLLLLLLLLCLGHLPSLYRYDLKKKKKKDEKTSSFLHFLLSFLYSPFLFEDLSSLSAPQLLMVCKRRTRRRREMATSCSFLLLLFPRVSSVNLSRRMRDCPADILVEI